MALFIVAIGLTATLRATGMGTEATRSFRSQQLAQWLIQNHAAEHVARRDWPTTGETSLQDELGGERFLLKEAVIATPNPGFRRLEISAAAVDEPGHVVQRSVLFLTAP